MALLAYFALLFLHLTATASQFGSQCDNDAEEEPYIIESLTANYQKSRLPDPSGVDVDVELIVNEISALSEITSEFELDLFFSEIWYDRKLAYKDKNVCTPNITLDLSYLHKLWQPNICVVNSKQALIHKSPSENVFLILYSDGKVWRNCRMRIRAPCMINLKNFPFDTQPCFLMFESYSYNANKVHLSWLNYFNNSNDAVKILGNVELPDFGLLKINLTQEKVEYPNGRWDQLKLTFYFKRRYGFFVLQAYVPTYMVIFIAWINFWMDPKELSTRATLTISAFLAMTLQFGNVLSSMPRVSYIKAIDSIWSCGQPYKANCTGQKRAGFISDIWMLGGIIFLFISLAELAIISFVLRSDRPVQESRRKRKIVFKNWRPHVRCDPHPRLLDHGNREQVEIEFKRVPKDSIEGYNSISNHPINNGMTLRPADRSRAGSSCSDQSGPSTDKKPDNHVPLWFGRWSPYQIDLFFVLVFPPSFLAFNIYYWVAFLPEDN